MIETSAHSFSLTVYHLRFECEAQNIVHFGPQAGAQLRGALWNALQPFACTDNRARSDPDHSRFCPMCRLLLLETQHGERGANPARPFAIQPPLTGSRFETGESFAFGISLFGDVAELIPYVIQAAHRMGRLGVGYGRGQFVLRRVLSVNPLSNQQQELLADGRVRLGHLLPINRDQVQRTAARLPRTSVRLRFLTPTQIVAAGRFDSQPVFAHLIARLLERCQSIDTYYGLTPVDRTVWQTRYADLTTQAQSVHLTRNHTRWITVRSGSRRDNSSKPISGYVGDAIFEGQIAPFHEWLVWGQSLHVGKNAVKGNGWYLIVN
ncbi:MAG TPA: CRISPR system precrRNA processing endoribonuclease RAMP protein Cas6 [Spirillospora sp.]|nr:CRISPR system precrRNA processing endoribonuclease RAMP protein Cas6 [Spirillospora sp.]